MPLIVAAPWIDASHGQKTLAFAELVDLYPTTVALAGLPAVGEALDGTSLVPVLEAPHATHAKEAAFSQYPRCPQFDLLTDPERWECLWVPKANITRMGYTVRVADARYTEWRAWQAGCVADWSPAGLVASELYDHYGDDGDGAAAYDDFENVNLAHEPARRAQVQALAARLRAQFERAPGC